MVRDGMVPLASHADNNAFAWQVYLPALPEGTYGELQMTQTEIDFKGATYVPSLDKPRLGKQLATVKAVMESGDWLTLSQIAMRGQIRISAAASISARLRDLRRLGWQIDRRRLGDPSTGLWEYRLSGSPSETKEAA